MRVFYVGDGGGDFCAATRLRAGDVLFAREGWALHRKCEESLSVSRERLYDTIKESCRAGCGKVIRGDCR